MPHIIASSSSSSTTSINMATPNPLMALVDAAALLSSSSSPASSSSAGKPANKRTCISPSPPTQSMMVTKTVPNDIHEQSRHDDRHRDTTMVITPPVVARQQLDVVVKSSTTATPRSTSPLSLSTSPSPTNGFTATLCDALDDEHVHLLQWMPSSSVSSSDYPSDGSSFTITDTKKFTKTVLPQKFNIRNMSSFLRKLYQLGFKRHHDKSTMNFDIFSHPDLLLTADRRGKNVDDMQTQTTSVDGIKVEERKHHEDDDDGDDASRATSSSKASMTTAPAAVQPVAPSLTSSSCGSAGVVINGIESTPLPAMPSFPASSSSASRGTAAAAAVGLQQYNKGTTMVSSSSLVPRLADVSAPSDDTTDPAIKAALLAAARIQTSSSSQLQRSHPQQTNNRMSLSRIKIRHHLSIMDRLRLQHECMLRIEQQQQQASLIAMITSKTNRNQSTTMMGTEKAHHMHLSYNSL